MRYEDILEDCLGRLRAGAAIDDLVALHPQYAASLRADLEAAASLRRVSAALPSQTASAGRSFQAAVAEQREHRAHGRTRWASLRLPVLALGAVAAVVIAVLVIGGLFDTQSAEAGTIEGVVVQSSDGGLTVQTQEGLQTVAFVTGTEVLDERGGALALAGVEPGQFVVIRGEHAASGFAARRIEVAPLARLAAWCESFAEQCVNLEGLLQAEESACRRGADACENLRNRLNFLRSRIEEGSRLEMLRERCESGANPACREVLQYCDANPDSCESFREWLRNRRQR